MAEKQLFTIRNKFVDSVTKPMISQLLDDLLQDEIVNQGEKEYITESNPITKDRARELIDTVRKKGEVASGKLLTYLKERDPTLYSKLVPSCAEPAPPAKEKEKEKEKQEEVYPVTENNIKSRVALLITNITFTNKKLNRSGAERDEENMEKLLKTLGYEVVKYTNLTGKEIDDAVLDFSKHPKLKETDSVWVVIMSHGKLGAVLGVNSEKDDKEPDEFPINNIYTHLNSENCPALLNKPKIIIIQACRGEDCGSVLVSDSAHDAVAPEAAPQPAAVENMEADTLRFEHKEKDFLAFLSCTPDNVSYRQRDRGSLLIQFIVEIFIPSNQKDDIEELFRKVMRRFEDLLHGNKRQMPTRDRCTLTRRFYVFPAI